MEDLKLILSLKLKSLRRSRNWSQYDLAKASHVDRSFITDLENCKSSASVDTIAKLAAAFDVPGYELLKINEDEY